MAPRGSPAPDDARGAESLGWLFLLPVEISPNTLLLGRGPAETQLARPGVCGRLLIADRLTGAQALDAGAGGARHFDLAVVQEPERVFAEVGIRRGIAQVRDLAGPAGCVAIRVGSGAPGVPALRQALGQAGFLDVQVLASVADRRANWLLPVSSYRALSRAARFLTQHPGRLGGWHRRAILRWAPPLLAMGPARRLLSGGWVLARAPGNYRVAAAEEMVRTVAATRPAGSDGRLTIPGRVRTMLRHRSFSLVPDGREQAGGSAADYLVFFDGWAPPACVLRIAVDRAGAEALGREQDALRRLRDRLPRPMRDALAEPLGIAHARALWAAAYEHVPGPTLSEELRARGPRGRRRLAEEVLPAAADWLASLHRHTSYSALLRGDEALAVLEGALTAAGVAATAGRLRPLLHAIAAGGTRAGASHGALSPGRLVLLPGGVGVTGWDHVSFHDLPLLDLFQLADTLAQALLGGRAGERERAFRFAFGGEGWYARCVDAAVRRYCCDADLPPETAWLYLPLGYLREAATAPGVEEIHRLAAMALAHPRCNA